MTDFPIRGSRTKPPHGGFFLASGDFFENLVDIAKMKYGETYAFYYQIKMVDPYYPERGWTGDTYVQGPDVHTVRSVTSSGSTLRVSFTDNRTFTQGGPFDEEKVWAWKV